MGVVYFFVLILSSVLLGIFAGCCLILDCLYGGITRRILEQSINDHPNAWREFGMILGYIPLEEGDYL